MFLNPARQIEKERIINKTKNRAKHYFNNADMSSVYPELFRLLWLSTLL